MLYPPKKSPPSVQEEPLWGHLRGVVDVTRERIWSRKDCVTQMGLLFIVDVDDDDVSVTVK